MHNNFVHNQPQRQLEQNKSIMDCDESNEIHSSGPQMQNHSMSSINADEPDVRPSTLFVNSIQHHGIQQSFPARNQENVMIKPLIPFMPAFNAEGEATSNYAHESQKPIVDQQMKDESEDIPPTRTFMSKQPNLDLKQRTIL